MRLKHLELHGFKTFASKTEFVFPTGITAIVGPNGSGKSNVADSVRWVLGEQNFSTLRAKKSEDLVFAGGEGRARSGMAEAHLTLDNSDGFFPIDFSEVTITRRAYRDGQNEYLINGSKVRLRDITELLSQSGLAQRTYTVIGQGLIDRALSLRADERRALFEEAAGISLYQQRRGDALRRLDETQHNLERVKDIMAEIGPRVKRLQRQAGRAEEYKELSAELDVIQRVWFGYHWGQLQNALRNAKESSQAQDVLVAQRRDELSGLGKQLETLRARQLEQRQQLAGWHRESSDLHRQSETLQRELAVLSERTRLLQQQADQAQHEIAPLEIQLAAQQQQVARAERDLAEIQSRIDHRAHDIDAATHALQTRQSLRASILDAVRHTQAQLAEARNQIGDWSNQTRQLLERHASIENDIATQRQSVETLQIDLAEKRAMFATRQARHEELEAQIAERRKRSGDLSAQLETLRALQNALDADITQARAAEAEQRARYDALRAARATLTGFDSAARAILSADLRGVHGALARLIDVQRGWERAVAAALDSDLQAILVDDWAAIENARTHIGADGGRVTFIPLDALRRQSYPLPFGVQRAIDVVICEDNLRPALDALLAHYVLVDDMQQARALFPTLPPGVHIVTRNGDVLRSNGAIVTGHANGSGELLTVEREWRELPATIQSAAEKVAEVEARRAELAAQTNTVIQQQEQLAGELREWVVSAAQSVAARDEASRQVEAAQRELAWKNERIDQAASEAQAIAQKVEALAHEIAEQDQHATLLEQIAAALDQRLAALPIEELAAQVTTLQTEGAVSEQLRQGQENVLRSHRASLEQAQTQIDTRNQRIAEIAQEHTQVDAHMLDLREREQTLAAQLDDYRARIEPIENDVRSMEEQYARIEQEERNARTRLQELEGRLNLAVMEVRRREDELNHMRERIDEELGLVQLELADLTAPQPLPLAPIVTELPVVAQLPEGLEQQRQLLKAQIRRLGPINPEAQLEYDTLSERFEFLETQSTDLAEATTQLQQVIAELDQLMEATFRQTFERIAEEFKGTFHTLFGGGSARLVLTEPDNLMESGIDILARPPGKKQQSLALLSGGERSLTAAALLFAILKVTPPPFCIMDETDAALDEANIARFRDMIRAQGNETQFVLITHNRGTIEAADTIYGITMERDSSSRAYSLKLEGDAIVA